MARKEIELEGSNPVEIIIYVGIAAVITVGSGVMGFFYARKRYERKFEDLHEELREKDESTDMASAKVIKQTKEEILNILKYLQNTDRLDKRKLKLDYQRIESVLYNL